MTRPSEEAPPRRPALVIVCGAPGTGKTTLARLLAARLAYAILTKDDIKEALADELGAGDRERSKQLGRMAYELLFTRARDLLTAGKPVIVEANFHRDASDAALRGLAERGDAVVIECVCDPATRRRRFAERGERGERHRVHLDREILVHEWSDDVSGFAIDIGCPRLVVETSVGHVTSLSEIEAFASGRSIRDTVTDG